MGGDQVRHQPAVEDFALPDLRADHQEDQQAHGGRQEQEERQAVDMVLAEQAPDLGFQHQGSLASGAPRSATTAAEKRPDRATGLAASAA
jgi:hypothetical protein